MFKKILIANHGEMALRIIHACREMGIKSVAVYSAADVGSLYVRFTDEAVCMSPPASKDSYLEIPNIIATAEITSADAVHPGYGSLLKNTRFSGICAEHGIKFIRVSPEMVERTSDKASAKATMKEAGVPMMPGSNGLVQSLEHAKKVAAEIGYPVMLRATAGDKGRGMRDVWKEEDLEEALDSAMQEAGAAFGNDAMCIEKLIIDPRHVEIQIVGDQHGKACHPSERNCSIQHHHQRLTEETPSPFVTEDLRKHIDEIVVKAVEYIKYGGAGTVEFLIDKDHNFCFMEMNTRIQVKHPIAEQVIDYDLIREQILVAAGVPISGENYTLKLHTVECRINIEDPYNDFRPLPSEIATLYAPDGHGVRLGTHMYGGYVIPPNYDSMMTKFITTTQMRGEAIAKIHRVLDEFVVEDIRTTMSFHLQLMDDPDCSVGNYTTKFMEDFKMKPQVEE